MKRQPSLLSKALKEGALRRELGHLPIDLELDEAARLRRPPPSQREEGIEEETKDAVENADQEPCTWL